MEKTYLIDTNVVIYYSQDKIPAEHVSKVDKIFKDSLNISSATKVEVLGFHRITLAEKLKLETLLENALVLHTNNEIVEKAIEMGQKNGLKLGDSIIAATALVYNLTLVTRNQVDFQKVKDLNLYNPFKKISDE
ncbi:MAG: type II toxin-antitoxin system VapC family toxin [Bacteroidetes bacterium]|nr:MAG: type II toxin-antitoxin system VapC family toxin [Bacteroidota bacterium]